MPGEYTFLTKALSPLSLSKHGYNFDPGLKNYRPSTTKENISCNAVLPNGALSISFNPYKFYKMLSVISLHALFSGNGS